MLCQRLRRWHNVKLTFIWCCPHRQAGVGQGHTDTNSETALRISRGDPCRARGRQASGQSLRQRPVQEIPGAFPLRRRTQRGISGVRRGSISPGCQWTWGIPPHSQHTGFLACDVTKITRKHHLSLVFSFIFPGTSTLFAWLMWLGFSNYKI